MPGLMNIVVGGVFVIGVLTGNLVMRGTQSTGALVVIGIVAIGMGLYRLINDRR